MIVLRDHLSRFLKSRLLRVFISSGFTTGIKIISAVVLSKVIALKLGPSGLALIGQLTNFVNVALLLSTGGLGNGIIKYIAEIRNPGEKNAFVQQSLKLTIGISLVAGLVLIAGCRLFSHVCFDSYQFTYIFLLLGFSIILYAIHNYFLSFLNGMGAYKVYNWINGVTSVSNVVLSIALILFYGLPGALTAVAINQTVSCLISFLFVRKYLPDAKGFLAVRIEKAWVEKLLSFSVMALVSAATLPLTQIAIRKMIISQHGLEAAGQWEAMIRISYLYLAIIINVMLVYYVPRLSSLQSKRLLEKEVRNGFMFFAPVILILTVTLFLLKDLIINLLLTPAFLPIKEFFPAQLLGDIFKVLSYIYAYMMIAKAFTRAFIVAEISCSAFYILLSGLLIPHFGTIGAIYSYCMTYFLFFVFQYIYIERIYLRSMKEAD